ncbi:MAG: anthranilate synthase component I [Propionibacteriaceae bacterium]|nr:anthranilate synthase component I [Propionibacteriaceae bacterium]
MAELRISPDLAGFREQARDRRVISVHARVTADDLTPVGLYRQLCGERELTFLLESAEAGVWSRYSIVGVNACSTLTERDGRAHWLGRQISGIDAGDPLTALRRTLEALHTPPDPELPPFHSGMVGYLGYDVVRRLERLPDSAPDDLGIPELVMMLASDVAVLDHHTGQVWLIANAINFDDTPERLEAAYEDAVARVRWMVARLAEPRPTLTSVQGEPALDPVRRQREEEEYQAAVLAAQEQIRAGEAFQIVVSQRFEVPVTVSPFDAYRALRLTNPSPYLYYLSLPGFAVIGSSPEALVTVRDQYAATRPIAGTRPRGSTPEQDQALAAELVADPKERAEHVMLVDLGRNDLGRVCVPGTVTVREFMGVHRYSHVMHMEAEVTGVVAEGYSALDVTLACFPAGTLTGAPKVRAMEIIDSLEVSRRGVYGGVVGYLDFAGNSDMAIAIRTAVLREGVAYVQAGAGIVADSLPAAEEEETRNKAAALIRALAVAEATGRL